MRDEKSAEQDSTIGAGFCTFYPHFRKLLAPILRALISHGEAYTPDTVLLASANGSYTKPFDPRNVDEFDLRWKDEDPGRTFWKFEKTKPAGLVFTVGDTVIPYRTLLVIVNREHIVKDHALGEFLGILRELYNLVHPFYGTVWINEMITRVKSPIGTVTPGFEPEKGLPDANWANFLGPEYVKMFGAKKVFSTPVYSVDRLPDGGALLLLSASPFDYQSDRDKFERLRNDVKLHLRGEAFHTGDAAYKAKIPKFRYREERKADQDRFFATDSKNQNLSSVAVRIDWEDWVRRNETISSIFVSEMRHKGLILDFSEASLDVLDKYIEKQNESGNDRTDEFATKIGAYLSQVIIKNLGASWTFPQSENYPSLKIGNAVIIPFARALKVLEDGEKLGHWFRFVETNILRLDPVSRAAHEAGANSA